MSRKRFSAEQWRLWFEEFATSKLTVEQFCKSKRTTANTFYNWRKKLKSDREIVNSESMDHSHSNVTGDFVSVTLAGMSIEIELPGGAILRVPSDRHLIEPVLQVLFDLAKQS